MNSQLVVITCFEIGIFLALVPSTTEKGKNIMKKISSQKLQLKRVTMAQIGTVSGGATNGCTELGEACQATSKGSDAAPSMRVGPNACAGLSCGYEASCVKCGEGGDDAALVSADDSAGI